MEEEYKKQLEMIDKEINKLCNGIEYRKYIERGIAEGKLRVYLDKKTRRINLHYIGDDKNV